MASDRSIGNHACARSRGALGSAVGDWPSWHCPYVAPQTTRGPRPGALASRGPAAFVSLPDFRSEFWSRAFLNPCLRAEIPYPQCVGAAVSQASQVIHAASSRFPGHRASSFIRVWLNRFHHGSPRAANRGSGPKMRKTVNWSPIPGRWNRLLYNEKGT